jgi:electron transfer flavoprotein-quinone oxidoreductase
MNRMNDFDAIVVGAGPAGVSAALTMARKGMKVALLERGPYPGSKNLMGGVLYTDVLGEILPDFRERGAPLERHVAEKRWSLLSAEAAATGGFRTANWDRVPNNHSYTILRARFDKWYAAQAEAEGVELVCGVVVDEMLKDAASRIVGVRTRMPEGEDAAAGDLRAPIVIVAEGANSLLAEKEGMRPALTGKDVAISAKEVIKLSEEKIEDRFGVEGSQGVAWEFIGDATGGIPGAGFIYTNRDTVSVGVVLFLSELSGEKISPIELLDRFKSHPAVRPLLRGGELLEYGAHLIPETGIDRMPLLAKDGLLLVGDAAGLVATSPRHEGSNYAMASGRMAGEAAAEAHAAGDYIVAGLSGYKRRLDESFVIKNMERYRDWPGFLRKNPQIFDSWPAALAEMAESALRVGGNPSGDMEAELWELFQRRIGLLPFGMTAMSLRNALRILGYGKSDKLMEYISRNW